jgi:hypothetical protein
MLWHLIHAVPCFSCRPGRRCILWPGQQGRHLPGRAGCSRTARRAKIIHAASTCDKTTTPSHVKRMPSHVKNKCLFCRGVITTALFGIWQRTGRRPGEGILLENDLAGRAATADHAGLTSFTCYRNNRNTINNPPQTECMLALQGRGHRRRLSHRQRTGRRPGDGVSLENNPAGSGTQAEHAGLT